MFRTLFALGFCVGWMAGMASGQRSPDWVVTTPAASPPTRGDAVMVFDRARGEVVLFGGRTDLGYLSDTWVFDGQNWRQRTPSASPSARYGAAATYDSQRQRVVVFGGTDDQSLFDDTWEWDGSDWTQVFTVNTPPPRVLGAMAYESTSQRTVLYGGDDFTIGGLGDTWIYDGSQWISIPSGAAIGNRSGSMVFFGATGQLLFLGRDSGGVDQGFAWGGISGWTRFPGFDDHRMRPLVVDELRGLVVMPAATPRVFDGSSWRQEQPSFVPFVGSNGVYDASRGALIAFGYWQTRGRLFEGLTYQYRIPPAVGVAGVASFGVACTAPGVPPRYLAGVTATPPRIGATTTLRAFTRDPQPNFLLVGTSRTTLANGTPLPWTMPLFRFGCALQVRPDLALPMVRNNPDYAEASIAIPASVSLAGISLFCQEVQTPGFDMFFSNGVELRVGF